MLAPALLTCPDVRTEPWRVLPPTPPGSLRLDALCSCSTFAGSTDLGQAQPRFLVSLVSSLDDVVSSLKCLFPVSPLSCVSFLCRVVGTFGLSSCPDVSIADSSSSLCKLATGSAFTWCLGAICAPQVSLCLSGPPTGGHCPPPGLAPGAEVPEETLP